MSILRRLLLASSLVLVFGAVSGHFARGEEPNPGPTVVPLPVFQSHGFALKSKAECGYRLIVRGAPGTRYEVDATPIGGDTDTVGSGTIPTGGMITIAIYGPTCPAAEHTIKVAVTSRADARVRVALEYF